MSLLFFSFNKKKEREREKIMERALTKDDYLKRQIKNIALNVYDFQEMRIGAENRIRDTLAIKRGLEMGDPKLLQKIMTEYSNIRTMHKETGATVKRIIKEHDFNYILEELDYNLIDELVKIGELEKDQLKILTNLVHSHPMWKLFFKDVKGCGETMAGICIAYLDPIVARHSSSFWKFCGLDTVVTLDSDGNPVLDAEGNVVRHGRSMSDTEIFDYVAADGSIKQKTGITYNPLMKSKMVGVLADCILRAGTKNGNKYAEIYYDYKTRLENSGKGNCAGHRDRMAKRYMIKQFLRDLWVVWREYEGYEVTEPYEVAVLGHPKHGYNRTAEEAAVGRRA